MLQTVSDVISKFANDAVSYIMFKFMAENSLTLRVFYPRVCCMHIKGEITCQGEETTKVEQ